MRHDEGRSAGQRPTRRAFSGIAAAMLTAALTMAGVAGMVPRLAGAGSAHAAVRRATLHGLVRSGRVPISAASITLYRAASSPKRAPVALGRAVTHADGSFAISYPAHHSADAVLYLIVGHGASTRLASVLSGAPGPRKAVVNERTTVAAGVALAQFISGGRVAGRFPGPQDAAAMAGNLVDARTAGVGRVLQTVPNGRQTSALRTFNSLSNMLVDCVRSAAGCRPLFELARAPRSATPRGTLQAVADIARNPWHNVRGLFALTRTGAAPYQPALGPRGRPDAWILALRFYGDGKTLNGPGNSAIDARGNVWVINNYTYSRNPLAPVCGGKLLFKFTPSGRYAPGSPYSGGGVDGDGYGVTFDPRGNIWVGNFGFSSANCAAPPLHNSVSEFTSAGRPLSPDQSSTSSGGFTAGNVSWPQGTVSDEQGNIWIANCGNSTVTRYADGNPKAFSILSNLGIAKPFDIAFNRRGQAFVTGNGSPYGVAMLNPDGTPTARSPITAPGMSKPLGIAADSHGNMWVSNSARVSVPCPDGNLKPTGSGGGSVSLIHSNGAPARKPFTGGGLTVPWGIAVDGDNNVWVSNFAGQRVSELCGSDRSSCPPGTRTGAAISPPAGYGFNGLTRNTSLEVDPSGNLWITNNWKTAPLPRKNPGGYEMVVYLGVAGPVRTPLIGPPRSL